MTARKVPQLPYVVFDAFIAETAFEQLKVMAELHRIPVAQMAGDLLTIALEGIAGVGQHDQP